MIHQGGGYSFHFVGTHRVVPVALAQGGWIRLLQAALGQEDFGITGQEFRHLGQRLFLPGQEQVLVLPGDRLHDLGRGGEHHLLFDSGQLFHQAKSRRRFPPSPDERDDISTLDA